ncbi:MAG: hypothetical protein JSW45_03420 [Thiotrichales bacterium]|nr:MAG: hypothetical protein JSW45_03420 [Thiotrichales bacterium]
MTNSRLVSATILPLLLFFSLQTSATSVLPISLQRMTGVAAQIFHGKVTANEVKLDPASGRVVTYTRFEIIEVIKGDVAATRTIKQLGGQLPGSDVRQIIHGVPAFSVGQEYVVFLPKASRSGFSSPVGLSQGKFDVRKSGGESVISHPRAPAEGTITAAPPISTNLPGGVEIHPQSDKPSTVTLADFLQTVRGMTRE